MNSYTEDSPPVTTYSDSLFHQSTTTIDSYSATKECTANVHMTVDEAIEVMLSRLTTVFLEDSSPDSSLNHYVHRIDDMTSLVYLTHNLAATRPKGGGMVLKKKWHKPTIYSYTWYMKLVLIPSLAGSSGDGIRLLELTTCNESFISDRYGIKGAEFLSVVHEMKEKVVGESLNSKVRVTSYPKVNVDDFNFKAAIGIRHVMEQGGVVVTKLTMKGTLKSTGHTNKGWGLSEHKSLKQLKSKVSSGKRGPTRANIKCDETPFGCEAKGLLDFITKIVTRMHKTSLSFNGYDQVDKLFVDQFLNTSVLPEDSPTCDVHEKTFLRNALGVLMKNYKNLGTSDGIAYSVTSEKLSDSLTIVNSQQSMNLSNLLSAKNYLKAKTLVCSSKENVLGWLYMFNSYRRNADYLNFYVDSSGQMKNRRKIDRSQNNVNRELVSAKDQGIEGPNTTGIRFSRNVPDSRTTFQIASYPTPLNNNTGLVKDKVYANWCVWDHYHGEDSDAGEEENEEGYVFAFCDLEEYNNTSNDPFNNSYNSLSANSFDARNNGGGIMSMRSSITGNSLSDDLDGLTKLTDDTSPPESNSSPPSAQRSTTSHSNKVVKLSEMKKNRYNNTASASNLSNSANPAIGGGRLSTSRADLIKHLKSKGAAARDGIVSGINSEIRRTTKSSLIRGSMHGIFKIVKVTDSICEVTMVVWSDSMNSNLASLTGLHPNDNIVKYNFAPLVTLANTFDRAHSQVDAELRQAFREPTDVNELNSEQQSIVKVNEAMSLFGDDAWLKLPPSRPLLAMYSMRPSHVALGQRAINLGKAEAVVDCSAKVGVAWWYAHCSREWLQKSFEAGHPARIIASTRKRDVDQTVASVRKSSFWWCRDREYVFRQICAADGNTSSYIIASQPVDDVVDYGTVMTKTVRGVIRSYVTFNDLGRNQCKVTYYCSVDEMGRIPASFVNSRLPSTLSEKITVMMDTFERNAEIDTVSRKELADKIENETQGYLPEEEAILQRVRDKLGAISDREFQRLRSPDKYVRMFQHFISGESSAVGRATTIIDAPIADCAAWEMHKMSREHSIEFFKSQGKDRELVKKSNHHFVFHQVVPIPIHGFLPREFVNEIVWKWTSEESKEVLEVAVDATIQDSPEFPYDRRYLRALSMDYYKYEKLPPLSNGIPQTRCTKTQIVDIFGAMPVWLVNRNVAKQLGYLTMMRTHFDRSNEVDDNAVLNQLNVILAHEENPSLPENQYTKEENDILDLAIKGYELFESGTEKFNRSYVRPLKMKSELVQAKIAAEPGDPVAWGVATTTVSASSIRVMAWLRDTFSRFATPASELVKCVVDEPNHHNKLIYIRNESPQPGIIRERDYLNRTIWKFLGDGNYICVSQPEKNPSCPEKPGVVRANKPTAVKLTCVSSRQTRIEFLVHPDSGGSVPKWYSNKYIASHLSWLVSVTEFFQWKRELDVWNEEDGRNVAEILVTKRETEETSLFVGETKFDARLRILVAESRGLKSVLIKYPFFNVMMSEVLENKLRPASDVKARLYNLNDDRGKLIGGGMAVCLISNLSSDAAIDEWIGNYPALQELDKKEVWFRPMMNTIGMRLMTQVAWGLKMRMYVGAALSTLDMVSDINVIYLYWNSKNNSEEARVLLGMVIACIGLQLFVVCLQNKTRPRKLVKSCALVLTGLKPVFDAKKVIDGAEMEVGDSIAAHEELVAMKVCELFCESIPGCIVQSYALLKAENKALRAIVSIAISALTAGFVSASISFDYDVDPNKRKMRPDFYGYVPNSKRRTIVFFIMVVNSSLLLLVRSVSAALLMRVRGEYFFWYLLSDSALFVFQKVARGDFHYWIPLKGLMNIFVSLLMRVIIKACADFTGVLQFRHPYELGGLYWTLNMLMALGFSLVAVQIYAQNGDVDDLSVNVAWNGTIFLTASWLISFAIFLTMCNKGYRRTFFSTGLGKQMTIEIFTLANDDADKSVIMSCNENQWISIEAEVKAWVQEGWWRWHEEKPLWFTDAWKSCVNKDWVPGDEDGARKKHHQQYKGVRRSSVSNALAMRAKKVVPTVEDVEKKSGDGFFAALEGRPGGKRQKMRTLMRTVAGRGDKGKAGEKKKAAMDAAAAALQAIHDSSSDSSSSSSDSEDNGPSHLEIARQREAEEREEEEKSRRQQEEKERLEKEAEERSKFREMNGWYYKMVVQENGSRTQTKILDSKASLY